MNLIGVPPQPISRSKWLFRIAFEAAAPTLIFKTKDPEGIKALHWLRKELLSKNIPLMGNIYAENQSHTDLHEQEQLQGFVQKPMLLELQNDPQMPKALVMLKNLFCAFWKQEERIFGEQPTGDYAPEIVFECGPYEPRHKVEIFQSFLIYALVTFKIMRPEDYPDYDKHQFILSRLLRL
jgi:hypothetical protein